MTERAIASLTSVVVVSYCSATTLLRCIDSVLSSNADVELILVDNGSEDDSVKLIQHRRKVDPRVKLVANSENRGFGAACNQGAAMAAGDVLFFLNPDAFLETDTVERLRAILAALPETGLLGARVVDESGRTAGPVRRREPTLRRSVASLSGLARWQDRWPALAGVEASSGEPSRVSGVEWVDAVNGAAMMVPRAVFQRLAGFDEGFRLHAEDLDLCRRVRDAGYPVAVATDVAVVHIGGVSSRRRPYWVEWQKTRSLWRYFRKHDPARSSLSARVVTIAGLACVLLLRCLMHAVRSMR